MLNVLTRHLLIFEHLNYLNRSEAALNLLNCRKASIRLQNYSKFFNFTKNIQ